MRSRGELFGTVLGIEGGCRACERAVLGMLRTECIRGARRQTAVRKGRDGGVGAFGDRRQGADQDADGTERAHALVLLNHHWAYENSKPREQSVKRVITIISVLGLVVPGVAAASRVATGSSRKAIASGASEAAGAGAYIYWANGRGTSHGLVNEIGRARLNGTGVDRRFIAFPRSTVLWGVAVNSQHVYWTAIALPPVGIGRANLNGTGVDRSFMPVQRSDGVVEANTGFVVNGGYIYWTNTCCGTIGRANLNGTDITPNFIAAGAAASEPVAITAAGGYIYWANEGGKDTDTRSLVPSSIGRAHLDGTDVNQRFIVGAHTADAVTVAGGYIYWANLRKYTIGRAKLNGTGVNQRFMTNTTGLALANHGRYIYGSDFDDIWRAKLNGTNINRHFIPVPGVTDGLAIHWDSETKRARSNRAYLPPSARRAETDLGATRPTTCVGTWLKMGSDRPRPGWFSCHWGVSNHGVPARRPSRRGP
jgi:Domain of unknown function (DUF5050)